MAEDESGTLGLMIPKSSREKISPTVRASRENALERTRQLEVLDRGALGVAAGAETHKGNQARRP